MAQKAKERVAEAELLRQSAVPISTQDTILTSARSAPSTPIEQRFMPLFQLHYFFISTPNTTFSQLKNIINALCDNQAYVNKLTWILEDDYNHHGFYKKTEAEETSLILKILPSNFSIEHIKSHQDDKKSIKSQISQPNLISTPMKLKLSQHLSQFAHILIPYLFLYISMTNTYIIVLIIPYASHLTLVK